MTERDSPMPRLRILKRRTLVFCWLVMRLDVIPRYGRLYRWNPLERTAYQHWSFQRWGRWGFNLLDRMGLIWPYLYHRNPDMLEDAIDYNIDKLIADVHARDEEDSQ